MADLRMWSRQVISDFIELYKTHACLWNMKCEGYKNKYTKSLAYKDLVLFCKKRGFPEANRDFVSRKLQSLRGSFRKELRKIEKVRREGKPYETNLWYYKNLMFIVENNPDGDQPQSDSDQNDDDHQNDDDDQSEQYEELDDDEDENFLVEEKTVKLVDLPTFSASPEPPSPQPKKRKPLHCPQPEFLDIGPETTKHKHLSEFELTGMNIAKKLARMDETQAIYAESLINTVIRRGLLKKLKEETDLCDNLCAKRIGVNLPSQSSSDGGLSNVRLRYD